MTTWQALLAGRFISEHSRAVIDCPMPRVNFLAKQVALEAVENARWIQDETREAALIVGTSKGPIEAWIDSEPSGELFGLSTVASFLAGELELGNGPRVTFSTACSSGLHALIYAANLIAAGRVERAIVVAAESSLHPLFVGSFRRLGVLPAPGVGCKPFDENRDGFLMSEAAAAVCLERTENARLFVDRVAVGGDAVHLTHGDPAGRTLRRLLASVADERPVDLVHAHATGTVTNDPVELAAIQSVLSGQSPVLYSHKGALGHSLGAAGLVSVVLNCQCHGDGKVPPNVRTAKPLPMDGLQFPREVLVRSIGRSVAIASGFGGPLAVVSVVSK